MNIIKFIRKYHYKSMIITEEKGIIIGLILLSLILMLIDLITGENLDWNVIVGIPVVMWLLFTIYIFILIASDYYDYKSK